MNSPTSDWLVLIRPSVAGFDSTRDTPLRARSFLSTDAASVMRS